MARQVWDVDEYVFGTNGTTLAQQLAALPPRAEQLCINSLTFGSSGHTRQPHCISASNLYRKPLPAEYVGKCVQRLSNVSVVAPHRSVLRGERFTRRRKKACVCATGLTTQGTARRGLSGLVYCASKGIGEYVAHACTPPATEGQLEGVALRLHHYASQSQQMMHFKQLLGGANTVGRKRGQEYWARAEWADNLQYDPTLRDHPHRADCMPAKDDAPARPLELNLSTRQLTWDTWSALPATVAAAVPSTTLTSWETSVAHTSGAHLNATERRREEVSLRRVHWERRTLLKYWLHDKLKLVEARRLTRWPVVANGPFVDLPTATPRHIWPMLKCSRPGVCELRYPPPPATPPPPPAAIKISSPPPPPWVLALPPPSAFFTTSGVRTRLAQMAVLALLALLGGVACFML